MTLKPMPSATGMWQDMDRQHPVTEEGQPPLLGQGYAGGRDVRQPYFLSGEGRMSDEELCKALRSALWGQGHHINIKAADRIEQLERDRDKDARFIKELCDQISSLNDKVADWSVRAEAAEAKLAKAVEALREIAGSVPYADNPWQIALAALAELEKQ